MTEAELAEERRQFPFMRIPRLLDSDSDDDLKPLHNPSGRFSGLYYPTGTNWRGRAR